MDGDSVPMVDMDCGSFTVINPRTASRLMMDKTYEIETSKGVMFSPDILNRLSWLILSSSFYGWVLPEQS